MITTVSQSAPTARLRLTQVLHAHAGIYPSNASAWRLTSPSLVQRNGAIDLSRRIF
jgi:hypothetical protein